MTFPLLEFSLAYTAKDIKVYTFMIRSVARAYRHLYFNMDRIKKITIRPELIKDHDGTECLGILNFRTDMMTLSLPVRVGALELRAIGGIIGHEFAHHIIQEYYGEGGEANRLGNNLVHYWANTGKHTMAKYYYSPTFIKRYGFPFIRMTLPDVDALIANKESILAEIKTNKGYHKYW